MFKSKERISYYNRIIVKKNSSLNTKKNFRDFREGIKLIQEGDLIFIKQILFTCTKIQIYKSFYDIYIIHDFIKIHKLVAAWEEA